MRSQPLEINIEPFGPDQKTLDSAADRIQRSGPLAKRLKACKYNLLRVVALDGGKERDPVLDDDVKAFPGQRIQFSELVSTK